MKTTIDDLLAKDDSDLVNGVFVRLVEAHEAVGALPESPVERAIVFAWHAHGLIGNGGLEYFYERPVVEEDPELGITIEAFRALGLKETAQAIEDSTAWFPGAIPPRDPRARLKHIRAVPKSERDRLHDRMLEERRALPQELARFIRTKKAEIERILQDYEKRSKEPVAVHSSWDIGAKSPEGFVGSLTDRLRTLAPGQVLEVRTTHAGSEHLGTARWFRIFAGMTGNTLVRAEPPRYFLRRGELMEETLELNRRAGRPPAPTSAELLPAIDASRLPGVFAILLLLLVLLRILGVFRR